MNDDPRKVLLVTGAAHGIGAATARLAGRQGYAVAVNYRGNPEPAEQVVAQIRDQGGMAEAFHADVGQSRQVEDLFARIDRGLGPVTALVNNAATSGGRMEILDLTPELLQEVFSSTLFGAFYCIQAAVARMARSRGGTGGTIVNVGSEAARFGGHRLSAYAAAKAGLHTLTVGLARELAPQGIRINAVSPGIIDTHQQQGRAPEQQQAVVASLPLGRMGTPEEVAQTILWLLSEGASYVTGVVLPVAGGR
jgi:NAD(P)-dependent dehydrogenase (short-subunit alcohol dehydrogenase family)